MLGMLLLLLTYPDKNEYFCVADPVFALRDSDHGELGGAGAFFNQISNL